MRNVKSMMLPKIYPRIKKMPKKATMAKKVGQSQHFKESIRQSVSAREKNSGVYFREG
jgi:hypothetical protein